MQYHLRKIVTKYDVFIIVSTKIQFTTGKSQKFGTKFKLLINPMIKWETKEMIIDHITTLVCV